MGEMGLQGVIRGKPVRTTVSDKAAPCPLDHVNRQFHAPAPEQAVAVRLHLRRHLGGLRLRRLRHRCLCPAHRWLAGQPHGARQLRPGRARTGLARAAPAASRRPRPPFRPRVSILSINYTERLAEAGVEPSVGSVGDSYDNALAETINGLYKAEVIHRRGPWRCFEAVEFATLDWVDWFNNRRLLEPIGNIPPAEAEAAYYAQLEALPIAA